MSEFLKNLKSDLKIGEVGYPQECVVCGDQQTYSIILNLKTKFPDTFKWIIPMPGDWHLLKLAAESICDMLWDGGLRDLAKLCGHHKEINQWRDVHHMLLASHECLLMELVTKWNNSDKSLSFEDFHKSLKSSTNLDEVSQFWSKTLDFLNAYMGYTRVASFRRPYCRCPGSRVKRASAVFTAITKRGEKRKLQHKSKNTHIYIHIYQQ